MGRRAARRGPRLSLGARLGRRLRKPLPLVVCVDVEPDERRPGDADSDWAGFELLLDRVGELRDRVAELAAGPTALTWFVRADPQIEELHGDPAWALRRYRDRLVALRDAGDEIGVHAHAWRRDGERWLVDHGDPKWVEHCFATAIAAYREVFGTVPPCARGGDRFLNERAVALLEQSGVLADVTVEPRMPSTAGIVAEEPTTGELPDYTSVPEVVYRPSTADFRRAEGERRRLVMVPLTAAGPELLYPWMDQNTFSRRLNERLAEGPGSHLAFAVRSDLPLVDVHWERVVDNLGIVPHVVGVTVARRLRPTVASRLARASG